MTAEVANEMERRGCRLSREHVIDRVEVGIFERRQELITEGSVQMLTFVVFPILFLVLLEDFFSSKGYGHSGMVGVRPGSVGWTKGTGMTSVYCVAIRVRPMWPFCPLPCA